MEEKVLINFEANTEELQKHLLTLSELLDKVEAQLKRINETKIDIKISDCNK